MKEPAIQIPVGCHEVLLHACCAPCSSAIVEWLLQHDIRPTIFYYNPNIFPREEYEIRKQESKRHAESLGIHWIDGDYDHQSWLNGVCGLEGEPERGRRCEKCFTLRLVETAKKVLHTGHIGDGKIFTYDVENVIRVRTGEEGYDALQSD